MGALGVPGDRVGCHSFSPELQRQGNKVFNEGSGGVGFGVGRLAFRVCGFGRFFFPYGL